MNTYSTSTGERVTKRIIDRNIRKAKEIKVREFKNYHGFIHCEICNTRKGYIDISHIISVKYCQETGRSELAWAQNNLRFLCRDHHDEHDTMTNQHRELIFKEDLGDLPF